jgi:hypothetical protein
MRLCQPLSSESRFQRVFISLVVLGIIIACLGLFGLATFAAQQRIKGSDSQSAGSFGQQSYWAAFKRFSNAV